MIVVCLIFRTKKWENNAVITNHLLTAREGRTGEYWPEVVTVRTERNEVRTKTTEGQYSTVRLEQARLVSCLLYGTLFLIVKCTSSGLHLKLFVLSIFFAVLVANFEFASFAPKQKYTDFPWKRSVLQNPDRERTNQSTGICRRLGLPYNKYRLLHIMCGYQCDKAVNKNDTREVI